MLECGYLKSRPVCVQGEGGASILLWGTLRLDRPWGALSLPSSGRIAPFALSWYHLKLLLEACASLSGPEERKGCPSLVGQGGAWPICVVLDTRKMQQEPTGASWEGGNHSPSGSERGSSRAKRAHPAPLALWMEGQLLLLRLEDFCKGGCCWPRHTYLGVSFMELGKIDF